MFWRTPDAQVEAHYSHAHLVMDALVASGWTEAQARESVERLWRDGRAEGYEDAMYDAYDHD